MRRVAISPHSESHLSTQRLILLQILNTNLYREPPEPGRFVLNEISLSETLPMHTTAHSSTHTHTLRLCFRGIVPCLQGLRMQVSWDGW